MTYFKCYLKAVVVLAFGCATWMNVTGMLGRLTAVAASNDWVIGLHEGTMAVGYAFLACVTTALTCRFAITLGDDMLDAEEGNDPDQAARDHLLNAVTPKKDTKHD